MHILQVVHGYPPHARGGMETYTRHLALSLRARGHEMSVFCRWEAPDLPDYYEADEEVDGIAVRRVVYNFDFSGIDGFEGLYRNLHMEELFAAYVARVRPDVIHFQHVVGLSASLIERAQREGWPHVVTLADYWFLCPTVHRLKPGLVDCPGSHHAVNCLECIFPVQRQGSGTIYAESAPYRAAKRLLPSPVRRALLGGYDLLRGTALPVPALVPSATEPTSPIFQRATYLRALLAGSLLLPLSEFVRQAHLDFGVPAAQLCVFPPGVDLSPWAARPAPRVLGPTLRFGFLGSLQAHKGVDEAVRAFRQLDAPHARLQLHGFAAPGDAFFERLRALAEGDPRIEWCGSFAHEALPAILDGLDVLLLPSAAQETYSFVAWEAAWAGLPVIATRVGALPEAVQEGVTGFLVPPRDTVTLAAALQRYIKEPTLWVQHHRAQLGRAVRSIGEQAGELERLYTELITRDH